MRAEQALHALGVVARDDGSDVRQRLDGAQRPGAEVERRRRRRGRGRAARPPRSRSCAARWSCPRRSCRRRACGRRCRARSTRPPAAGARACRRGRAGCASRRRAGSSRRSTVAARSSSHGRRGAGMPVADGRGDEVAHEPLLVVRAEVAVVLVGLGRRRRPPTRTVAPNRSSATFDLRRLGLVARPAAGVRRLERARADPVRSSRCRGRGATGRTCRRSGRRRRRWSPDSSAMRSATRRLVLARRLSLMTPAGRCVAMIRWMPSERPRWAMSTTPSTNSGTSPASAANSSMTSTSAGGVSGSCRFSSSRRSFAFLRLNRCSRWCSSARRLVSARRTRCGLRSVTRPTQCGSSTQSANAEPPL